VQITPDAFEHWAEKLEEIGGKGNDWDDGRLPSESIICLFIDGIYSTSRQHLVRRLSATVHRSELLSVASAGFSYRGYGVHYPSESTIRRLELSKLALLAYLSELKDPQRIIPISFSLGSAVTLLALNEWLGSGAQSERVKKVPALIFIGPAHAPALGLYQGYRKKLADRKIDEIPWPVRELCQSESARIRREACAALESLSKLSEVHVIFSESDLLTPFYPVSFPLVHAHPITIDDDSTLPLDAVKHHTALLNDQHVRSELSKILDDLASRLN
jgi:hypothetical protein